MSVRITQEIRRRRELERRRSWRWGFLQIDGVFAQLTPRKTNSSDRDFAALIFSGCVIGLPFGAVLGLIVLLTWFQ